LKFPTLHLYGRLLRFLRPHLGSLGGSILFMIGFAAFSGFSLAMIVPFTEIVLSGAGPDELARKHSDQIPTGIPGLEIPLPGLLKSAPASSTGTGAAADSVARAGRTDSPLNGAATSTDLEKTQRLAKRGFDLRRAAESKFYQLIRGRDRKETLGRFCLALFLIFLIKNLLWYGQSYLVVRVEQNVIRDIRDDVFRHYQGLSMEYFSQTNSGTLISRVTNDIELVKGAIANGIADLLRQGLLLLVYLITVLMASWQLFLFAILVLPPNLWLIDRIGGTLRRASRISQVKMARITSVLGETLGAMRIVKAFGLESERVDRFRRETEDYSRTMIRMTRVGSLASPLTEVLGVLVAVAILWFAGSQIATSGGGAGRFLLFIVGMLSMMQPIKVLSQVNIKIQQGLAAAGRIFDVLDTRATVIEAVHPVKITGFARELRMEDVCFGYRADVPVLEGINTRVGQGEVVALVGPSGGGKSTLVDLIPRFHDPTGGRITLDGIDVREIALAELRALIGLVTQETILFEGSVGENIALGRPGASRAEIEEAARTANAWEFISRLPEGFDTPIGERGHMLSGGQRQRLAIARALLKNPEILIFDEATSALDTESESLVQAAMDNLLQNRTAIVIAHRLSTVRDADRIVVLDGGRIVQEGPHQDLLRQGGLYRRLYDMQFRDVPAERPASPAGSGPV
jgi:ATP-binding cassette, subfamily B, bacterial MsbA